MEVFFVALGFIRWAMVFAAGWKVLRHLSALAIAFLEGDGHLPLRIVGRVGALVVIEAVFIYAILAIPIPSAWP